MVLVDTAVWVQHLRQGSAALARLLTDGQVVCHPFVVGELACGHLKNRSEILGLLSSLPCAEVASHEEVLQFIDAHRLMGKGLGYVDIHILASAVLTGVPIWTLDKQLRQTAVGLDLSDPRDQFNECLSLLLRHKTSGNKKTLVCLCISVSPLSQLYMTIAEGTLGLSEFGVTCSFVGGSPYPCPAWHRTKRILTL
jgi:predicted nucleic acid-binding protein